MRIGISTATFFGRSVTENSLDIIKSLGVKVAEIFLTTFYEYEEDFVNLLVQKKGNLEINSIHSLTNQFEPQLFSTAERTSDDAYVIYHKMCRAGQLLGAKYYTFHGISMIKKSQKPTAFDRLAVVINNLIDIAKGYGIMLSYENVHWCLYNYPGFFNQLHKYCPELKGTLDIKQAMQSGYSYLDYIKDIGQSLSTVHLCDYDDNNNLTIPGKGTFDYDTLFKTLMDNGYQGDCILELYSNDYETFDEVKRSYEYLQDKLYKATRII